MALMDVNVRDLALDDLRIGVTVAPERLRLDWHGESRLRAPEALAPFLDRVVADARSGEASVELRFERLTYVNSATLAALLRFMKAACEARLAIHVVLDARSRWQKIFADTLSIFDRKDGRFHVELA